MVKRYEGKDVLRFACPKCGYFALNSHVIIDKKGSYGDLCGQCRTVFPLGTQKILLMSMDCQCGHNGPSMHNRGVASCIGCHCEKFIPTWVEVNE